MTILVVNDNPEYFATQNPTITVVATTVGNILVLLFGTLTVAGSGVTSITGGGTWTKAAGIAATANYKSAEIWTCLCTSSVTSISVAITSYVYIAEVLELSGCATSSWVDQAGVNNADTSTMVAPTLATPAVANEMWIAVATAATATITTISPTNGFTVRINNGGSPDILASATLISTDSLAHTTTYPLTGTAYWNEVMISIKPLQSFTVTFNNNGGAGSMTAQVESAPTALTTNTFTRTGHTFTGWNTAANGSGTAYANGATYPFTASVTLYAQWVVTRGSGGAPTMGWQFVLNSLAGTTNLGELAAANAYAGTTNLGLLAALNAKAGTTNLGLDAVCNTLAGTTGLSALGALNVEAGY